MLQKKKKKKAKTPSKASWHPHTSVADNKHIAGSQQQRTEYPQDSQHCLDTFQTSQLKAECYWQLFGREIYSSALITIYHFVQNYRNWKTLNSCCDYGDSPWNLELKSSNEHYMDHQSTFGLKNRKCNEMN